MISRVIGVTIFFTVGVIIAGVLFLSALADMIELTAPLPVTDYSSQTRPVKTIKARDMKFQEAQETEDWQPAAKSSVLYVTHNPQQAR